MYAPTRVAQIARDAAMAEAKRLEAEAAVMEASASTIQGIVVGREARREVCTASPFCSESPRNRLLTRGS